VVLVAALAVPRAARAEATCYRLPFNNPNLADGWGSTTNRPNPHRGVDFAQAVNTPIPSVAKGVVRLKTYSSCLGNVVVVEHPDGMFSGYCHMNAQSTLAVGATVEQRDVVGKVGNTGTCTTGPHLHLTMSPTQGGWAAGTTVDPYKYIQAHNTCNSAPKGAFDTATCDAITGWAQDPDSLTAPIDVHLYFGGPAGDPNAYGMPLPANQKRPDLCGPLGSCDHGFSAAPPLSFFDGVTRPVFAYAIDAKGGPNTSLGSKPLTCAPLAIPTLPIGVVRRHVPDPAALAAWHIDGAEIASLADAALAAVPQGPALTAEPALVTVSGNPMIYVREYETMRPIPNLAALHAWELDAALVKSIAPEELAAGLAGAEWTSKPFLAKGMGNEVYVIDAPPPLWAELVGDDIPSEMRPGTSFEATLRLRNRGSLTWKSDAVALAPTPRDVASPVCDQAWPSCTRAATITGEVAPTKETTLRVRLTAPGTEGTVRACFGLVRGTHWFSAPGANGPSDDGLCRTITVTRTATTPDVGPPLADVGPQGEAGCALGTTARSPHASVGALVSAFGVGVLALVRSRRRRTRRGAAGRMS
jgi:hypothetical protein